MVALSRRVRISSKIRGVIIGVLTAAYGVLLPYPKASFKVMFAIGVVLQLAILFVRKFVPADKWPQAQYVFELIADAATVLVFAFAVFGSIARLPESL
jgi:hypothetical protein